MIWPAHRMAHSRLCDKARSQGFRICQPNKLVFLLPRDDINFGQKLDALAERILLLSHAGHPSPGTTNRAGHIICIQHTHTHKTRTRETCVSSHRSDLFTSLTWPVCRSVRTSSCGRRSVRRGTCARLSPECGKKTYTNCWR